MNRLEQFAALAARARQDVAPSLDASARVIARLRHPEPVVPSVPMFAFAGVSLAAASVVVALALNALATITDPLGCFFYPLSMVIP